MQFKTSTYIDGNLRLITGERDGKFVLILEGDTAYHDTRCILEKEFSDELEFKETERAVRNKLITLDDKIKELKND